KDAVPVLRRSLGLELRDPPPVEVVDGCEIARRGEQAVIEEAQRLRPILSPVSGQQGRVPGNELLLLDGLGRQRVDATGLGLSFDRDDIDLDQRRMVEPRSGLPADDQIYAVDLAQAFQPRRKVHGVSEQRIIEVFLRAEIADDTFPRVDPDAYLDRLE